MKSPARALVASVLVAAAGLATAQDRPPSSPQPPEGKRPSSPSRTSLRHFVTGTLVGFDVEKGTVTFKDESGKRLTWPIEVRLAQYARAYAEMRLQTLKEGTRVIVVYAGDATVNPRVYDVMPARGGPGQGRDGGDGRPAATPTSPAPPQ